MVYALATELVGKLRSREIGAEELLREHLARVRQVNPALNAVIALDEESAIAQARRADSAAAAGNFLGPLHGLPMTIKDSFEVVGMPTTCGLPSLRNHMPRADAAAVAALRKAGAIIFGKTNVPAGAGDHQTYNDIFGRTDNPWDTNRTPGGSSGGAAAAVAAGMSPVEIGSDIGGSIRVPAHFCGIFGHNPSFGVVPLAGHIPPPPGSLFELPMATAGPFARSSFDLSLMMDVLGSVYDEERNLNPPTFRPARHTRLSDFRVALWADNSYPLDSKYMNRIHAYADRLRGLGVSVVVAKPDLDTAESARVYALTLFGIWSATLPDDLYRRYADAANGLQAGDQSWSAMVGRGSTQSLRDWNRLSEKREGIRRIWHAFFKDYDVLICPVISTLAFPHSPFGADHAGQLDGTVMVDGRPRPYLDLLHWPGLITLPKLPSTVMPMPHQPGELPAGVQIVSDYLEDRTTLSFAQAVEMAMGGFTPPPLF